MKIATFVASALLGLGVATAQQPPMKTPGPGGPPQGGMGQRRMEGRAPMAERGGEMRQRGPFPGGGKWWKSSEMVQRVGISEAQVQQMEKIFQEYRLKLIDQHAALQKEEVQMEPLIESDQPDEAKVVAQIDRVANARAALEKSNALMMLGIRKVMTTEQWKKLQELTPPPPPPPPPPMGGEGPIKMKRRGPAGELE